MPSHYTVRKPRVRLPGGAQPPRALPGGGQGRRPSPRVSCGVAAETHDDGHKQRHEATAAPPKKTHNSQTYISRTHSRAPPARKAGGGAAPRGRRPKRRSPRRAGGPTTLNQTRHPYCKIAASFEATSTRSVHEGRAVFPTCRASARLSNLHAGGKARSAST